MLTPETPITTGMRRSHCSTSTSATRSRSASVSAIDSLAFTGATMPCAPAATQKSTQRRSEAMSSWPPSSKGVGGMANTPRKRGAVTGPL